MSNPTEDRERAAAMLRHPAGSAKRDELLRASVPPPRATRWDIPPGSTGRHVTPPTYGFSMDDTTRAHPRARTGTDDVDDGGRQQPLPFDDAADDPIAYQLTARARRQVAPDALPDLRIVDGAAPDTTTARPPARPAPVRDVPDGDLDLPGDTRPSRARALRRAGVALTTIADQLDVDELIVRAWIGDVTVHPAAGRRTSARRPRRSGVPNGSTATASSATDGASGEAALDERRLRFETTRATARDAAAARMATDPAFAAGLGLLAGLAVIDEHAVTVTTSRPDVAARLQGWLVDHARADRDQVRVVLRLGPGVAGDLARHRWAQALGLPPEQVVHTRWRGAPRADAEEALVRLPDRELAATLAGWRDALLGTAAATSTSDAF